MTTWVQTSDLLHRKRGPNNDTTVIKTFESRNFNSDRGVNKKSLPSNLKFWSILSAHVEIIPQVFLKAPGIRKFFFLLSV